MPFLNELEPLFRGKLTLKQLLFLLFLDLAPQLGLTIHTNKIAVAEKWFSKESSKACAEKIAEMEKILDVSFIGQMQHIFKTLDPVVRSYVISKYKHDW